MRRLFFPLLFSLLVGTLFISGCTGLTSKSASSPQSVQNPPATPADISISPASVSFRNVPVGGTASQSVAITNTGGSDLVVTNETIAVQGVKISGGALPLRIVSGKQATMMVEFSPKATGNVSGTLSVTSNAAHSPDTIAIQGSAVAATALLNASASTLNFGNVTIGTNSALKVTLSNAGNSDVTVSKISSSNTRITTSGVATGLILAPGQTEVLDISLDPSTVGALSGTVTVTSDATNSPLVISVSGAGAQASTHSVKLSWTADASAVAGYIVHRSTVSGGPYASLNFVPEVATTYTDGQVQSGATYYYVVTSISLSDLESVLSNQVSVTIP